MKWHVTNNRAAAVGLSEIPESGHMEFYDDLCAKLGDRRFHVADYFAHAVDDGLRLFCILLDDGTGEILTASHRYEYYDESPLASISALHPQMHPFEREISELFGIRFADNPWDKPLRYPFDRVRENGAIDSYPFYSMEGESLHEVNVGPIHAGIIEPGAFRFICNGERVLHLEISLGYQHRGVEYAMRGTHNRLRQAAIAESIAGDTAVGHASAYAAVIEKLLPGYSPDAGLDRQRVVGLELERIAMHIADSAALCMDIGYQLGQVACEALRTIVINTTQLWCGNRFGKGLVRPAGTDYPLTASLAETIVRNITEVGRRYTEIHEDLKRTSSVLSRFEDCGVVGAEQMLKIGGVGMAARASCAVRDIRNTHPWGAYGSLLRHEPITREQGDVMARLMIRGKEIMQSAGYVAELLHGFSDTPVARPDYGSGLRPDSLSFSVVEGWRGEICHAAVTGADGHISCYKIKDPSVHNWLALALAVRGEGISDFPICNKSFNLSYCGHDL